MPPNTSKQPERRAPQAKPHQAKASSQNTEHQTPSRTKPKQSHSQTQESKKAARTPNSKRHPPLPRPKQGNHQVHVLFTKCFMLFGSILASPKRTFHPDTALRCGSIAGEGRQVGARHTPSLKPSAITEDLKPSAIARQVMVSGSLKAAVVGLAKRRLEMTPPRRCCLQWAAGRESAFVPFERRRVDSCGPQGVYLVFAHLKLSPGLAERRQGPPIKDKMHRCGRGPAP
jgi:hypothetical protein